jgi:hypothetical protein
MSKAITKEELVTRRINGMDYADAFAPDDWVLVSFDRLLRHAARTRLEFHVTPP